MAPIRSGRILALDYGRKRIGLAISDECRASVTPLAILIRKNRADDLRRLRQIAREHEVAFLVVGLPLHLDGTESEMSQEARAFAARLQKHLGLAVEQYDERLTSWEAAQSGTPVRARKSKSAKAPQDDLAAAILLRDYLAHVESSTTAASSGLHTSPRPTNSANTASSGKH